MRVTRRSLLTLDAESPAGAGRAREYWIEAQSYETTPTPSDHDDMMGMMVTRPTFMGLRYRAMTPNWNAPLPASDDIGPNVGIPGPVIRARVGDEIIVHFRNADSHYGQPHSIRPFGVFVDAAHDGTWTSETVSAANAVPYGGDFTYRWRVPATVVGAWAYQDGSRPFRVDRPGDPEPGPQSNIGYELGLVGFIVIEDPAQPRADHEFFLVFHAYLNDIPGMVTTMDINGRSYLGSTPNFAAKVGDRVRWHIMGARQSYEHNFHVHGHRWRTRRGYDDVVTVIGDEVATVEWIEDNPGRWLYHCHVEAHMEMTGWYEVRPA